VREESQKRNREVQRGGEERIRGAQLLRKKRKSPHFLFLTNASEAIFKGDEALFKRPS